MADIVNVKSAPIRVLSKINNIIYANMLDNRTIEMGFSVNGASEYL